MNTNDNQVSALRGRKQEIITQDNNVFGKWGSIQHIGGRSVYQGDIEGVSVMFRAN